MGLIASVNSCLRNIIKFSGRASRSEFWWALSAGVSFALALFYGLSVSGNILSQIVSTTGIFLFALIKAAIFAVIFASLTVRRFHDVGKSGYRALLAAILFIATPILIVMGLFLSQLTGSTNIISVIGGAIGVFAAISFILVLIQASDPETNKYGPNPHEVTS
jgi:uncharacterized membrane protein YhaH (DUF805 family)